MELLFQRCLNVFKGVLEEHGTLGSPKIHDFLFCSVGVSPQETTSELSLMWSPWVSGRKALHEPVENECKTEGGYAFFQQGGPIAFMTSQGSQGSKKGLKTTVLHP